MTDNPYIITHHAPDLDAIGAVWMLKRFNKQDYGSAKVAFVNPGDQLSEKRAQELDTNLHQVTHVDTGLGRFDHHQPDRAKEQICATKLCYQHACQIHPELKQDLPLKEIVEYINQIDHFLEIHWPESEHVRYVFMLHELIRGHELNNKHTDHTQLEYGLECLDNAYLAMTETIKANQLIEDKGHNFQVGQYACLGIETVNDDTIKQAQKQGYNLVVRKDPKRGHIRIKVRPDSDLVLKSVYKKIKEEDKEGSWFYHGSGKMLLNGSASHRKQKPSPLSLTEIIKIIKQAYEG